MSLDTISPQSAYARYRIGQLHSRDIVAVAHVWLSRGIYTDSLSELSFLNNPQMAEVAPLFEKASLELGIAMSTREDAAKYLVNETLQQIAAGTVDPVNGASYLYELHLEMQNELPDLEYVGDSLGLENLFAWLREVWDCRDGSLILYYTDLPRAEAESRFVAHIRDEAQRRVADAT